MFYCLPKEPIYFQAYHSRNLTAKMPMTIFYYLPDDATNKEQPVKIRNVLLRVRDVDGINVDGANDVNDEFQKWTHLHRYSMQPKVFFVFLLMAFLVERLWTMDWTNEYRM
jgi:hypothetical protein